MHFELIFVIWSKVRIGFVSVFLKNEDIAECLWADGSDVGERKTTCKRKGDNCSKVPEWGREAAMRVFNRYSLLYHTSVRLLGALFLTRS